MSRLLRIWVLAAAILTDSILVHTRDKIRLNIKARNSVILPFFAIDTLPSELPQDFK